ncbi:hypothetical protein [Bartonella rattaustraliani]|uniref:hypothetical protein n=1 Tax=Bartonella rattaustraliani TaxID=481139 RepID=UPI001FCA615A|nr:hypothetical protein [Bartonella rattaustraliani]
MERSVEGEALGKIFGWSAGCLGGALGVRGGVLEVGCYRGVRGLGTEYRRQDVAAEQWEGSAGEVSGGRMLVCERLWNRVSEVERLR